MLVIPSRNQRPTREAAVHAVRTLIAYIGEDVTREGIQKTPERVIRAWEQDWGKGYNPEFIREQADSILSGRFTDGKQKYSGMVVQRAISFVSHCEHHMAEFSGTIDIAYIPADQILGLSKLARVVEMYSRRLQVQERLTDQIADFINDYIKPVGVGVVVKATHSCMVSRGVKQHGTVTETASLRGEIYEKPEVREEFYRLIGRK